MHLTKISIAVGVVVTPLLNIEITLEGGAVNKKQLIFIIFDQNQCDLDKKIKNSVVAFFVNPPEGADHTLKCVESKIRHHFYYKNF